MLELGASVIISAPNSDFYRARGKVVDHGDRDYVVELSGEELLAFANLNQGTFKDTELKRFFHPGSIVTVHNKDSRLDGEQGQVERYDQETDLFLVRFDEKMLRRSLDDWDKLVGFSSVDLSPDEEWRPEYEARILYPSGFWRFDPLKKLFSTGEICMHDDCQQRVAKRCLVNASGTVIQVDLCEQHVHLHGWCMDAFPFKK